jgi:glycosyltransferase involved in cell wall biosynthesis
MGLTTLEAMSCGVPAMVSDAGSLPELVPDDRFTFCFSNHEELQNKLKKYVNREWPVKNASDLARKHVVDNYSFLKIGQTLLSIYSSKANKEKHTVLREV